MRYIICFVILCSLGIQAQSSWKKVSGSVHLVLQGNDGAVYSVKHDQNIYQYQGKQWQKIGNRARNFVVARGDLYALSSDAQSVLLYNKTLSAWQRVGGAATEIYGGGAGLFAKNAMSEIYAYNCHLSQRGWSKISGPAQMVAGASVNGQYYLYKIHSNGATVSQYDFARKVWKRVGGAAGAIYAGGDQLYATNPQNGDLWQYKRGRWRKISHRARMFAVANRTGKLYRSLEEGVYQYNDAQNRWFKIGGPAQKIFVSAVGDVYATNPQTNELWTLTSESEREPRQKGMLSNISIASMIAAHPCPEMLWVTLRLLQRYQQNFPGGASQIESYFRNSIATAKERENLQNITRGLAKHAAAIQARVRTASLRSMSVQDRISPQVMKMVVSAMKKPVKVQKTYNITELPLGKLLYNARHFGQKYNIRLVGIKSHRDADDEGWEIGPDHEEPVVIWTMFGQNYFRAGTTDAASIALNEEHQFKKDINVFGGPQYEPLTPAQISLFTYQVVELDSDGPSVDDMKNTLKTAGKAVLAGFKGDWGAAISNGLDAIGDTIKICLAIAAGGHDVSPLMLAVFTPDNLLKMTSGSQEYPVDKAYLKSVGDYKLLSIRRAIVYGTSNNPQWSVYYVITRTNTRK
ncbi:tectonin domain-containing protein [Candidatus Uabimicrobium amorphum]|uniref:Uncharacterized protein n=1 Tax=Uabimicrobium amorphum TaxID=2596890 RepID=A0A5S9IWV5_UABAM|nr:tectonin domain-containing protein [Candidatus Uabimicrobium amorphum]BBM88005.1 hypothetical protein UABAM_06421 [Candidatus Uabimicrobium amorphum]